MSDIFDEVSSELKNEQMINLLKKYSFHLISGAVLIIIAVSGFVFWQKTVESKQQMLGAIYYNMQNIDKNAGDEKTVMESLDHLIKSNDSGYEVLAAFRKASILKSESKFSDAIAIYDNLSADNKVDRAFRDLSALMVANIIIANNLSDLDIEKRLVGITDKNNSYYDSGILLKAIYLKHNNKPKELASMFDSLDDSISPSVKEKLDILMEDNNDK